MGSRWQSRLPVLAFALASVTCVTSASAAVVDSASTAPTAAHAVSAAAPKPPVLKLLWRQEYSGAAGVPSFVRTRTSKAPGQVWQAEVNNLGGGNYERQYYTDGAVALKADGTPAKYAIELNGQGQMVINAARTPSSFGSTPETADNVACFYGRCKFQSGRINTLGLVGFKYGRLEARIKTPNGVGTWPAWWLMGANQPEVGWPACGEIDIMETAMSGGFAYSNSGTMHSEPDNGIGLTRKIYPDNFYTAYHTYALQWDRSKIVWSFDGKPFFTLTKTDATSSKNAVGGVRRSWPFDQEMFMIANIAMGGRLGGDSNFNAPPNATGGSMLIDWIRYYSVDGVGTVIKH